MKVVCIIFAGGKGTRLRPLTYFIPKVLLPTKKQYKLIDLVLEQCEKLQSSFNTAIIVTTGYYHTKVSRYLTKKYNNILILEDNDFLGTLGSLRQHHQEITNCGADFALLFPSDYIIQFDLVESINFLIKHKYEAMLYCSTSTSEQHYVTTNSNGIVTGLVKNDIKGASSIAYLGVMAVKLDLMDLALSKCPAGPSGFGALATTFIERQTAGVYMLQDGAIIDLGTWPLYFRYLF